MKTILGTKLFPARLSWIVFGLVLATSVRIQAAESFLPLRLGQVKPEGWLHAVLERDLISGYAGHLDGLLLDPTAVAYGPLVFSLPIKAKAEIVERFPDAGGAGNFCGYQYDPADLATAKRPLKLMIDRPGFGFKVAKDKTSDPRYPWDRPPLRLHGRMLGSGGAEPVVLLPMGSTLLRRTFFGTTKN